MASTAARVPARWGLGTERHVVPSQCSMMGAAGTAPPTAQASVDDVPETPLRVPDVNRGDGTNFHVPHGGERAFLGAATASAAEHRLNIRDSIRWTLRTLPSRVLRHYHAAMR